MFAGLRTCRGSETFITWGNCQGGFDHEARQVITDANARKKLAVPIVGATAFVVLAWRRLAVLVPGD